MAFVMTFDVLKSSVASYLERDDISDSIPTFIRFAEIKASRILKAQLATTTVTNTLTANNPLVTKPERWIETLSFSVMDSSGAVTVLKKRARETIQAMFPLTTAATLPKYYSEWQENYYYLGATPDQAYNYELLIYQQPMPLDAANQTNYLTDVAPDLLLYSTLLEAQGFLKNTEMAPLWQAARDECVQQLTGLDMRRQTDRQSKRDKGA